MTLNKYVYVIYDKWNQEPVTTHRGRSAWATPGFADRAYENWLKKSPPIYVGAKNRYEIRKAVMAVLP